MSETASIALCTCNGERFIAAQLASLAAQTHPPEEIILCDDASTDGTVATARAAAERLGLPCRIFGNEARLGFSANFEQALRHCRGEVIFFCDQDDVWRPEKLARHFAAYQRDPAAMLVASDSDLVDEELRPLRRRFFEEIHFDRRLRRKARTQPFAAFLSLCPLPGHTISIRSALRDWLLPIPDKWTYDNWTALLAAAVGRVVILDEALVLYRRHARQAVGTFDATPLQMAKQLGAGSSRHFHREAQKFSILQKRLADATRGPLPARAERLCEIEGKLRFLAARARMKEAPPRRWGPIFGQMLAGNYFAYGQGWLSLVRDLLGK